MDEEFQSVKAMLDGFALMAAQMEAKISVMQAQLEEIDGDFPQQIMGDMGGGGGSTPYASYFRVVDASDANDYAIGVTMGEAWANIAGTNCGAVKINGEYVEVVRPSAEVLSGDGTTYVWLHSWIDSSVGAQAEIIFGDDDPPDNPNGGIAFANQLLGRATLNGESLTIVQDYLRGGEHQEILFGNCEGGAIEAIQP